MEHRKQADGEKTIRVLIVDDHPLFREGLRRAIDLSEDIQIVGESETGEDALQVIPALKPDVILLDVNLPGMNGLQVARQLTNRSTDAAIIILTAHHDEEQVLHAMRTGAAAYFRKDVSADDLVRCIRDVASGYYIVHESRMDKTALDSWLEEKIENNTGPYIVDAEGHYIPLSPREMEILEYVTKGLINKEIARELGISQQTVKNHMTSILKKLNVKDRTQAAVTALRRGWVRIDEDDDDSSSAGL